MSERAQTGETTIVRAAIYPAIGIARVGNSETEYFLAPEFLVFWKQHALRSAES